MNDLVKAAQAVIDWSNETPIGITSFHARAIRGNRLMRLLEEAIMQHKLLTLNRNSLITMGELKVSTPKKDGYKNHEYRYHGITVPTGAYDIVLVPKAR